MKTIKITIITALLAFINCVPMLAQNTSNNELDSEMPNWFIGFNGRLGTQFVRPSQTNWSTMYLNSINSNIGALEASKGINYGFDVNLGYFFGPKKNFGIGTGIQYMNQKYTYALDKFSIEYQSVDNFGNTFRQGLRANNAIEEEINIKSWGLPILLLYKKQFNQRWGINFDAGLVLNLGAKSSFNTNAAFDYEAIYKFDNNGNPVYDNSPTPDPNDWLITKAHYEKVNTDGNVNAYFEDLYQQGYNVGLGVSPDKKEGDIKNFTVSTSWFLQPGISYRIKPNLALHGQAAYRRFKVSNSDSKSYQVTDKRGSYQSVTGGIDGSSQGLLTFSVGLRYYFGKTKAKEAVKEEVKVDPYIEKVKVQVKLQDEQYGKPVPGNILIKRGDKVVFNGVADASGLSSFYLDPGNYEIGVTAKGYIPAQESLNLLASEKGTSKTIELKQPKIEKGLVFKAKAVNFETGSDKLKTSSYDILNNMASMLKEYPQMVIEISGHTDNVGDDNLNLSLSQKRADAVKAYLLAKGASGNQISTKGYGETKPIADNATEEGRLKNRRVEFSVLEF